MNMIIANRDIILTGFMGTGKSAVGKSLADLMGRTFLDTDTEVERVARKTIAALFAEDGENHFRRLETRAIEVGVTRAANWSLQPAAGLSCWKETAAFYRRGAGCSPACHAGGIYRRIYGREMDRNSRFLMWMIPGSASRNCCPGASLLHEPCHRDHFDRWEDARESAREICAALEIDPGIT